MYLDYGKSTLKRTVLPSVSLLQKTPSSRVTCHDTGFYCQWSHGVPAERSDKICMKMWSMEKSSKTMTEPSEKLPPDKDPTINFVPIIGGVVALLLVTLLLCGVVIGRRRARKALFRPAVTIATFMLFCILKKDTVFFVCGLYDIHFRVCAVSLFIELLMRVFTT
ncbi:hypothetical protein J4Q44_G00385700 [Coregonus suidteri]|uniref:Uncharacterized protein n=1 Tax=Coregonus suidteri TaxID=861788 RepID=A0AAN8QIY6_9TELE